ncbi:hypothetical protein I4U23_016393 [Adineta vaga]|nr:hypothetical protein I4U23_016393 [Adineta vaga]
MSQYTYNRYEQMSSKDKDKICDENDAMIIEMIQQHDSQNNNDLDQPLNLKCNSTSKDNQSFKRTLTATSQLGDNNYGDNKHQENKEDNNARNYVDETNERQTERYLNESPELEYICEKKNTNDKADEEVQISQKALHYAVEKHLPPLTYICHPKISHGADAKDIIKEILNYIEKDFRNLNKCFNHPLGFDTWYINKNGDIVVTILGMLEANVPLSTMRAEGVEMIVPKSIKLQNQQVIYLGAIYIPPGTVPPFQLIAKHTDKKFFIFGDYNAKHSEWRITKNNEKITDSQKIVDILADFYEEHFKEPSFDQNNPMHRSAVEKISQIDYTPNIPLEQISILEVTKEWKKFKGKKSTDSAGTSAYMLKQLPFEYMNIITILFNKSAQKGEFFESSKHAKVICLSKDGLYPSESKLRPISLLPNIGKCMQQTCASAPQGSILAATLFRLHIHFLPTIFFQATSHLFADDLALVISHGQPTYVQCHQ